MKDKKDDAYIDDDKVEVFAVGKRGARGIWKYDEKVKYKELVKTYGNDASSI